MHLVLWDNLNIWLILMKFYYKFLNHMVLFWSYGPNYLELRAEKEPNLYFIVIYLILLKIWLTLFIAFAFYKNSNTVKQK